MNSRQEQLYQALQDKPILEWTKKDWAIHELRRDEELTQELRKVLKKDQTIYTILRSVSASGMMRTIDMFYVKDNNPTKIHYTTDKVFYLGKRDGKKEGYRVSGCGMDMGFHLVNGLSSHLFNDGYYLKHQWF